MTRTTTKRLLTRKTWERKKLRITCGFMPNQKFSIVIYIVTVLVFLLVLILVLVLVVVVRELQSN